MIRWYLMPVEALKSKPRRSLIRAVTAELRSGAMVGIEVQGLAPTDPDLPRVLNTWAEWTQSWCSQRLPVRPAAEVRK